MAARQQCEIYKNLKDRFVNGHHFPLPDLPSWFSLYQTPELVINAACDLLETASNHDNAKVLAFRQPPDKNDEIWQKLLSDEFTAIAKQHKYEKISLGQGRKISQSLD